MQTVQPLSSHFQKFRTGLTLASAALTSTALVPSLANAQTQVWTGVCVGTGSASDVATIQGLQCLVGNILMVAITLIGFAGFTMLLIGSFKYLLSGGNSKGTEQARNTITFAVVGLVVALSAIIIVNLIAAFTGVNIIREFSIPNSDTPGPTLP